MHHKPQVLLPLAFLIVVTSSFVLNIGIGLISSSKKPRSPSAGRQLNRMTSQNDFENYKGGDYKVFVGRGMARFRSGLIAASIADFDTAIALQPSLTPYMWQRGLSLYYANRFEEGAKQFRKDIAVNPNDTEEVIWAFLCDAKTEGVGFESARGRLVKNTMERRPYMRAAYSLFRGESKEGDLAKQMQMRISESASSVNGGIKATSSAAYFYSNLYLGLYSEAKGDDVLARKYITAAVRSSYGNSGDYMYDVARTHEASRGWCDDA